VSERKLTRKDLVKRAGVGAAAIGLGGASGVERALGFSGPHKYTHQHLKYNLSIQQWVHFVPAYDKWLDSVYIKSWGQANDCNVTIDHVNNTELPARAAAEVAAQSGHDIFMFLNPRADLEDQVIDHAPIVQEVNHRLKGKMTDLAYKSTYNPKTKKFHGFSDGYVPDPVVWRRDLWNDVGESPATWDHVLKAAPKLKANGHPIGIGMSNELDSNMANIALMQCFGSYIQNVHQQPVINSKQTVNVLNYMKQLYTQGMTTEIFGWNPASNNTYLYSGKASMILNAISATRTPEQLGLPFADNLWIWPIPAGPVQRLGLEHVMGVFVVWKFGKQKTLAMKYLADMETFYKGHFLNSQFYNFPSWSNAVPNIGKQLAKDTHKPHGKYTILGRIAQHYTANLGYPGYSNAAVSEIFTTSLIPQMFANVAQSKTTAEDAARTAQAQFNDIFKKWRDAGKL
jgi:multiple sugar transport system substrate-binding protein